MFWLVGHWAPLCQGGWTIMIHALDDMTEIYLPLPLPRIPPRRATWGLWVCWTWPPEPCCSLSCCWLLFCCWFLRWTPLRFGPPLRCWVPLRCWDPCLCWNPNRCCTPLRCCTPKRCWNLLRCWKPFTWPFWRITPCLPPLKDIVIGTVII